jgi:hypothetical protein
MTAPAAVFLTRLLSDTHTHKHKFNSYLRLLLHKSQPLVPFDPPFRPARKRRRLFSLSVYKHDQKKLLLLVVGWPAEPSKRRYLVNKGDVQTPPPSDVRDVMTGWWRNAKTKTQLLNTVKNISSSFDDRKYSYFDHNSLARVVRIEMRSKTFF